MADTKQANTTGQSLIDGAKVAVQGDAQPKEAMTTSADKQVTENPDVLEKGTDAPTGPGPAVIAETSIAEKKPDEQVKDKPADVAAPPVTEQPPTGINGAQKTELVLEAGAVDLELPSLPDHTVTISKDGLSAYVISKEIVHSKNAGAKATIKAVLDRDGKHERNVKFIQATNADLVNTIQNLKAEELA